VTDRDGREVIAAGTTLDDAGLRRMNYLVRGVINTNSNPYRNMKSRLFQSGGVALVVNSSLLTTSAPCQPKKSINFICYVTGWDWYK